MNTQKRVVVTGMGIVSALGCDVETFWSKVTAGVSGAGPITRFDASEYRCRIAAEVKGFDVERFLSAKEARRLDPFCHFAIGAAEEAVTAAGIGGGAVDPDRTGVLVSSGIGGLLTIQEQIRTLIERGPGRVSPLTIPMMISDMASGILSMRYGFRGPNLGIVTACASGTHSIGESAWMIRRGDADVMLAGGAEYSAVPLGVAAFSAMKALSTRNDEPERASRPFDRDRDGFVPGEGAAVLVLESLEHAQARGASILAEVAGYGLTGDAYHITAPDPEGAGAVNAIRAAMAHAGIRPEQLDYVNAHGTSTPLNDKTETAALKNALGERAYAIPVSSTKSMTGHALGAAGAIESVVCIRTILSGVIAPTINYENPDPECDLDYVPNVCRKADVRTALNLNLGFGGHNAALIFRRFE